MHRRLCMHTVMTHKHTHSHIMTHACACYVVSFETEWFDMCLNNSWQQYILFLMNYWKQNK